MVARTSVIVRSLQHRPTAKKATMSAPTMLGSANAPSSVRVRRAPGTTMAETFPSWPQITHSVVIALGIAEG